ncbi:MAG: pyruvate kinase [Desulfobacterales bacterium]
MAFPDHKTKIVATIGPASDHPELLRRMIEAGMDVARINFSHGDFSGHAGTIARIRQAAAAAGRDVAVLADLPGPKIRIGSFAEEPVALSPGQRFVLTTETVTGTAERVTVGFAPLPRAVRPGDRIFVADGFIALEVERVEGPEVVCRVIVGGELRSRKGLNLPGVDLGQQAFTDYDRRCLEFALRHGADAVGQSFVDRPEDLHAVRTAARELGYDPLIIAKIERAGALQRIEAILEAADGLMIARGDLGVEIPIEEIAVTQKRLIRLANRREKPVITATQMLESMIAHRIPTRAEATDVANAILDGTDAVMLSGESAMGRFPVESIAMLGRIAAATEAHREHFCPPVPPSACEPQAAPHPGELIAASVEAAVRRLTPGAIVVPTHSGRTARGIARFRLPVWVTAVSSVRKTCRDLLFSYGVRPVHEPEHPARWRDWCRALRDAQGFEGRFVFLTEGPSRRYPQRNHRLEIIDLDAA